MKVVFKKNLAWIFSTLEHLSHFIIVYLTPVCLSGMLLCWLRAELGQENLSFRYRQLLGSSLWFTHWPVKGKVFSCPVMSNSRRRCSTHLFNQGCPKMTLWSCGRHGRMPMAHRTQLPFNKVVPICLLAFACIRLAGAGPRTGNRPIVQCSNFELPTFQSTS